MVFSAFADYEDEGNPANEALGRPPVWERTPAGAYTPSVLVAEVSTGALSPLAG
jgi:hypothetical protein